MMEFIYTHLFPILFLIFLIVLNTLFLEESMKVEIKRIRYFIYFTHGPISLFIVIIQTIRLIMPKLSSGLVMLLAIMDKLVKFYILLGFGTVLLLMFNYRNKSMLV